MEGEMVDDVEALKEELAREKAKNAVLMEQVLDMEDNQADQDLESFSDVIPNDERAQAYWRGSLLENREDAVAELTRLRNRAPAVEAPAVEAPAKEVPAPAKPLHNREAAKPAVAERGLGSPALASSDRASAIRNRADQIAKSERISYMDAFRRAERELGA